MEQRHKITIILGEVASDCAAYEGEKKAINKIKMGTLDGMVRTYEMDTERDLKVLYQALVDFDGWYGYWICDEEV